MHQRLSELKDERVLGIKGNVRLVSQDEILLPVMLVNAVNEAVAAEGVGRVNRGPEVVGEGIAEVTFESG